MRLDLDRRTRNLGAAGAQGSPRGEPPQRGTAPPDPGPTIGRVAELSDPDTCREAIRLSREEADALADLLGAASRTGVSIVAVLRGQTTFPAPEPSFGIQAGDTAVVVGTRPASGRWPDSWTADSPRRCRPRSAT